MAELNVIQMINYVWNALVSTNALQLIGIELILLIVFAITNKLFHDKFLKIGFIVAEALVLVFYAYGSVNCFQIFLNNVVTNITEIVYFPTPLELAIVLGISYAISYFYNKKCNNKVLKSINVLIPMINTCLVVAMVKYIDIKGIAFDEFSVFTNKHLMSMNEIVMIMFVLWIVVLALVKVDAYVINRLANKHAAETVTEPELVTVNIDALSPAYDDEDEEEIEMPRLKASYIAANQI